MSGHRGVDLEAAHDGVRVTAPESGTVSFVGVVVDRPVITIDHGNGLRSSFEPVQSSLETGDAVAKGQAIGSLLAGHCGAVACVHWGVRRGEDYLNPLEFVLDLRPSILLPPTRSQASRRGGGIPAAAGALGPNASLSGLVTGCQDTSVGSVTVSGLKITYRRAGSGDPLVLLHGGFGFDSRSWGPQLNDLDDEFDVVAWDAPGCGGSDDPAESFTMEQYADSLAGFLSTLGLARPHILGLSFGGALALSLYARHPTLPRSLILAGAYAGWAGSLPGDEVQRRVQRISAEVMQPPGEWLPNYLPGMLTASAPREMVGETLALMSGIHPRASVTMLRAMANADLRGILPEIDIPTLVLHGEFDARSPLAVGRELHAKVPGSLFVVLPDVGHLSNIEAADAFNFEVRTFLRSLSSPSDRDLGPRS
jgi:pimeloyl-ACP methyl ester carboxylesterase